MSRQIVFLIAIFCGSFAVAGQQSSRPLLHEHREAASDLEIAGMVRSIPRGESRFVSREWLMALPRVSLTMGPTADFPGIPKAGVPVSGVYLDALAQSLGVDADSSAIVAICKDGYTATYSLEYLQQHRPLVVLTMDGLSLHEWALKNHQFDAEPYFIGYEEFVPAFRVLSHRDQPLEPTGVVKLRFDTEEHAYERIKPRPAAVAADPRVMQGYRIAQQNCLRCHNAGDEGGTKAGKTWDELGEIAKRHPQRFDAWVYNPQAIDVHSEMPPNKEYDKATLEALRRYFATFAVEGE